MAMKKATFLLAFLLLVLPGRAVAQFLGYTSPQTVGPIQVLNNVLVATASGPVQNLGQSFHFIYYSGTGTTAVEIRIEAAYAAGGPWFAISNTAIAEGAGSVFGTGYYPLVRVNLLTLAGGPGATVSAWYSGTSTGVGPATGLFRGSGTESIYVVRTQDATAAGFLGSAVPPYGDSGGMIMVVPTANITGVGTNTGAVLYVQPSSRPGLCNISGQPEIARLGPLRGGLAIDTFNIPAYGAQRLCVSYAFANAPTGGTFDVVYVFGATNGPKEIRRNFIIPLIAPGVTAGLSVQPLEPAEHTAEITVTGGPATCTFQLEGSVNSTTGVDGTWFALSGAVDCTVAANRMFHVVNKPVPWVRGNLTALAGGAAPAVTLGYLGVR